MALQIIHVGQTLTIRVTSRDATNALVDPDEVTFTLTAPDAGKRTFKYTTAQVTRESLGVFKFSYQFVQVGRYGLSVVCHHSQGDAVAHDTITVEAI